MSKYESSVRQVPYTQEQVYDKLSDLSHLEPVLTHVTQTLQEKENVSVEDIALTPDSISFKVKGIPLTLQIVEREPCKCIKFGSVDAPVSMEMWIQILPVGETDAKYRVTVKADIPFYLKPMVSKPLQEGVDKLAEIFSHIQYA